MARYRELVDLQRLLDIDFYFLENDFNTTYFLVVYPTHYNFKSFLMLLKKRKISKENLYFLDIETFNHLELKNQL
jgi:hypothetical protein